MIERDHIMRMISLLAQSLARVLLHKKAYEYPQAKREIDSAYKSLFGVSSEFVHQFSDTQVIELFGKDIETAGVKHYILGVLLKEEAEILQAEEKEQESLLWYGKSLSLLLAAYNDLGTPIEPEHPAKIEEVVRQLRGVEIPTHVKEKLFAFYDFLGKYDKAENVLFELVESDVQYVVCGLSFYERLLKKPEADLREGGLPRKEVSEGLESLKEKSVR